MGEAVKASLRRLETFPRPVVAAINGAALGGGLEIALAANRRIAVDDRSVKIGLPESTLGLLPGGGGVTRVVRMLGLQSALMDVLMPGTQFDPQGALAKGLIDEVVPTREELRARPPRRGSWRTATTRTRRGTRGTAPATRCPAAPRRPPRWRSSCRPSRRCCASRPRARSTPRPRAIMSAAVEGAQVDFDTASRIESRYFTNLVVNQQAKNMIQAFFFDLQAINSGSLRPQGIERWQATKVGVLGAGMMGAGIAYACARAGMRGRAQGRLARGRREGQGLHGEAQRQGRLARQAHPGEGRRAARPDHPDRRRRPTSPAATSSSRPSSRTRPSRRRCSPRSLPHVERGRTAVLQHLDAADHRAGRRDRRARPTSSGCTSSAPSTRCRSSRSSAARRPPTWRWPRRYDVVQQIRKTPIVVNDSRGFYTSRVIGTQINEGLDDARRGRAPGLAGAGRDVGRLPGRAAADQRRAQHGADGQDPQGHRGRRRARGHRPRRLPGR